MSPLVSQTAPPGVRSVFEYAVTETAPDATRPPHRGLPSSALTLVFAADAPILCSPSHDDWRARRGSSHDVCLGAFHTRPVYLHRPDHQEGVQVAIHPLAARRLLGLPTSALTELTQEGEDVLGPRVRSLFARVSSAAPGERCALVSDGLGVLRESNDRRSGPRAEVVAAWQLLERTAGRMPVAEVASRVSVSSRHLSTLLTAELGIGTKHLADLFRFEAAHLVVVDSWRRGAALSLADIAHAHGYADHSHLDRAYRRFAGVSPTGWIAAELDRAAT